MIAGAGSQLACVRNVQFGSGAEFEVDTGLDKGAVLGNGGACYREGLACARETVRGCGRNVTKSAAPA